MGSEVKVGKYEIISKLGEGGMGVVYKAKDPLIDRVVAIKKMTGTFAEDPEARERFLREARAVGRLQHPNIVSIYELGLEDNAPFMVMEFLEGQGLDRIVSTRAPLTLLQKLDYMVQVCQALHYAHEHDIVHRDVKPANVIVLTGGSQVKLVDFGIARAGSSGMTRTGIAIGTTSYMSPEQIEASRTLDRRSDVFSAGVMMYEILTYELPFPGSEPIAIAIKILREPYPPLSAYLPEYPPELDNILAKALAKDRDERYATAEDFAFELNHIIEDLRKDMVGQNMDEARQSFARMELARSRELLSQVLKAEPQHTDARQLMQQVQQLIQKQEKVVQVRDFRMAAEAAVGQDRYEDALALIEQAIRLDKTDQQLAQYRELILQGIQRKQEIDQKLDLADSAEQAEDLKTAEEMVGKALELDPTDTRARMMMAAVKRRLGQVSRETELKQLAELAEGDIKSHRFTGAHDVIRRIEALDPAYPDIARLKEKAVAEHTHEQQQNKIVDEYLGKANKLIADGRLQEALGAIEAGLKKAPNSKRLNSTAELLKAQIKQAAAMAVDAGRPRPSTGANRATTFATTPTTGANRAAQAAGAAAAPARTSAAPRQPISHPAPAPPEPKSKMPLILALCAVLAIGAGVGGYFAFRKAPATAASTSTTTTGAVSTGPGMMQINATPWATLKSVTDSSGKAVEIPADEATPVFLKDLPSGTYEVAVVGPDGNTTQSKKITVEAGQPAFAYFEFEKIDAKKIVDSY